MTDLDGTTKPYIYLPARDGNGLIHAIRFPIDAQRDVAEARRAIKTKADLDQLVRDWGTRDVRGEGLTDLDR
jgi:hypothetical protein